MMVPRGKYRGARVGDPPKHEAEHFVRVTRRAMAGSIAVISAKCSSTKGRCHTRAQDQPQ